MAKIAKSAKELAKMIRARVYEPELRIAVLAGAGGWRAKIYVESDDPLPLRYQPTLTTDIAELPLVL